MNRRKPFLLLACGAMLFALVVAGFAQGTAFFYQGQITDNGAPANGSYDLTFTLFNAGGQTGNALSNSATGVTNGLFSLALDFGAGVFNGSNYATLDLLANYATVASVSTRSRRLSRCQHAGV